MTPSLSNPFNRNPMNTQPTGPRMAAGAEPAIVRFRCKESPFSGKDTLARCRLWNGTTEGSTDYAVAVEAPPTVNADVYANRPYGGTKEAIGAVKVVWREVGGAPVPIKKGVLQAPWNPGTNYVVLQKSPGVNINVQIISPGNRIPAYFLGKVGDSFYYVKTDDGAYIIVGAQTTPVPNRKWEVIQNIGGGKLPADSDGPPQWAADYMRAHDTKDPGVDPDA